MKEIIAKIGRVNHLNHLINVMPLLTIIFGVQCYLIYHFTQGIQIGDYALLLGGSLAFFIALLTYYDNNHHVFICKDHLHVYFPLMGSNFEIPYRDIKTIEAPEEECNFSSLMIKTKHGKTHVFYFVDFPVSVKKTIEDLKNGITPTDIKPNKDTIDEQNDDTNQAA